ncbi:OLC1v1005645C2 [Oldenlandia corymbosa var. corymbosa]|uniref:OLC1v1005645C2 n=1 Tax=Oldenlandia corymbosa var. corymbosa TaxID=529605 RepID=A0AAV1DII9_OLDCO|nr:OLC1v1005645C2 [Oldenlandia corymbosa var. corymbosa]
MAWKAAESRFATIIEQLQRQVADQQQHQQTCDNTEEDITGSVDSHKDVDETIEAEEYPVPSALDETKNLTPSIDEIIRRASAPASKSLSDTKKLEMIAAVVEEVEKNSKVVEVVPINIIPPDWNIASTTGGLLMLEKNECTTPPTAISKEADELDGELTKIVEKILNEKPKRRNPARVRQLPERFRIQSVATINRAVTKTKSSSHSMRGLGLELEEQGLTVASMLAAKAFQFFKSYVACVFPRIELVST